MKTEDIEIFAKKKGYKVERIASGIIIATRRTKKYIFSSYEQFYNYLKS